jgi:hypothetical protein
MSACQIARLETVTAPKENPGIVGLRFSRGVKPRLSLKEKHSSEQFSVIHKWQLFDHRAAFSVAINGNPTTIVRDFRSP